MTTVGRQKTYTVLLCRLTALQQTLKSTVKMPNHCKAVEAGMQVRHACSCCAHAVLMLCSCCAHAVLSQAAVFCIEDRSTDSYLVGRLASSKTS